MHKLCTIVGLGRGLPNGWYSINYAKMHKYNLYLCIFCIIYVSVPYIYASVPYIYTQIMHKLYTNSKNCWKVHNLCINYAEFFFYFFLLVQPLRYVRSCVGRDRTLGMGTGSICVSFRRCRDSVRLCTNLPPHRKKRQLHSMCPCPRRLAPLRLRFGGIAGAGRGNRQYGGQWEMVAYRRRTFISDALLSVRKSQ